MITNLVAAIIVTLSTNVVETDNAEYESISVPCPENMIGCLVLHQKRGAMIKPATEKTATTTVKEKTEYEIDIAGTKKRVEVGERVVSESSKFYKLKSEWHLAEAPPETIVTTNVTGTTSGDITFTDFSGTITLTRKDINFDPSTKEGSGATLELIP